MCRHQGIISFRDMVNEIGLLTDFFGILTKVCTMTKLSLMASRNLSWMFLETYIFKVWYKKTSWRLPWYATYRHTVKITFSEEILKTPIFLTNLLTNFLPTFLTNFFTNYNFIIQRLTHEQLKVLFLLLIITLIDRVTTAKIILKSNILNRLHNNCKIEK